MRKFLPFLLGVLWLAPAGATKPVAPEEIAGTARVTAEEVVDLATRLPNLVIVDSRYREEYAKGHIEGAVNLVGTEMTRAELAGVASGPDTPLLFYCNGERCLRSAAAARKAVEWGYQRVYWFRAGWQEWLAKRLPVSQ